MTPENTFYDDLSSYYHLIFDDWESSMTRQGSAIAGLIQDELREEDPADVRILDVASGIGTQTIPLALRGFRLVARDLSPGAIDRLRLEMADRGLPIDAAPADMRHTRAKVTGDFDVVMAFDNSVPHLLTDEEILAAFGQFRSVLRPGGVFICSVRDYEQVRRGVSDTHSYGSRNQGTDVLHLRQEWSWYDPVRYEVTFVVDREGPSGITTVLRTVSRYYAISTGRLLELMTEAGFSDCRRVDGIIYQPVLIGRKPESH
jgi:glycine/sarcosine N-methyltransferase